MKISFSISFRLGFKNFWLNFFHEKFGYSYGALLVKINETSEYIGRSGEIVVINIGKEDVKKGRMLWAFAHENGHDVFKKLIYPQVKEKYILTLKTGEEMFADLNALYFVGERPSRLEICRKFTFQRCRTF